MEELMVAKKQIIKFDYEKTIKIKLLVKSWKEEYSPTGAGFLLIKTKYEWADGVLIDVDVIYKKNYQKIASQLLIAEDHVTVFGLYFTTLNEQKEMKLIINCELISREDDN